MFTFIFKHGPARGGIICATVRSVALVVVMVVAVGINDLSATPWIQIDLTIVHDLNATQDVQTDPPIAQLRLPSRMVHHRLCRLILIRCPVRHALQRTAPTHRLPHRAMSNRRRDPPALLLCWDILALFTCVLLLLARCVWKLFFSFF